MKKTPRMGARIYSAYSGSTHRHEGTHEACLDKGKEKDLLGCKRAGKSPGDYCGEQLAGRHPRLVAFKIIKPLINFMERYLEGKSLYEAAKMTAWEAADDVIAITLASW